VVVNYIKLKNNFKKTKTNRGKVKIQASNFQFTDYPLEEEMHSMTPCASIARRK
jgi:hypothetical protein